MKKILISLLMVLVVSGAAIAVFVANTKPVVPATAKHFIKDDNKEKRYIIDIEYPEVTALSDEVAQLDINTRLKDLVDIQASEFKKQVAEIADNLAPGDMSSGLWIDYTLPLLLSEYMSVHFTASNYAAGAAHPNNYSIVFNYDISRHEQLQLGDLFRPGSDYLEIISDYAISDLQNQFGSDGMSDGDWIKAGAAPTAENYRNFVIKEGSLVILFDPYQVASYAAGGREVVIPFEVISAIVIPGGPLMASR